METDCSNNNDCFSKTDADLINKLLIKLTI